MKRLQLSAPALLLAVCATTGQTPLLSEFDLTGDPLPPVRHVTEMKVSGDTLFFVHDSEESHGQLFLRRAFIDLADNHLDISPEIGKKDDGYYMSYMPYPFIGADSRVHVISQDDREIYDITDDTALVRTKRYLMNGETEVPIPLSGYIQNIFMTAPERYVFMGREPNGGRQYAMRADLEASRIDTIRQIAISADLQTWMPNVGEMVFSPKRNRLAFAYRLHPIVEVFSMDGSLLKSTRLGQDTFDRSTLNEADFEDLNPLHTVDLTYTSDYIYALYWSYRYDERATRFPSIIKFDMEGNIIERYSDIPSPLYRIAAICDSRLIGWTGNRFILITL